MLGERLQAVEDGNPCGEPNVESSDTVVDNMHKSMYERLVFRLSEARGRCSTMLA